MSKHAHPKQAAPAAKSKTAGAKPAAAKAGAAKADAAKTATPRAYGERHADQAKAQKPGSVPAGVSAGPSEDDRGIRAPKKVLQGDLSTRMLKYTVEGGGTVITLAAGLNQGLYEGMNVELRSTNGRGLADTEVYDVKDSLCKAMVHMTPDSLREHIQLVVRPR